MGPLNQEWMVIPIRTPAEYQLVSWALGRTLATFEASVAGGYLDCVPTMPRLFSNKLYILADNLLIEEVDYQLTVATRDDDDAAYFDPQMGDHLVIRIRQKMADLRIKRLFACRFVRHQEDGGDDDREQFKLRLVS